jgi:hypothetical protein
MGRKGKKSRREKRTLSVTLAHDDGAHEDLDGADVGERDLALHWRGKERVNRRKRERKVGEG